MNASSPARCASTRWPTIDRKGGLGLKGINNVLPLAYDKFARRGALGPEATMSRAFAIRSIRWD